MPILRIRDSETKEFVEIPAIKGEDGNPGVWTGSETPPEGYTVWIDESGDSVDVINNLESTSAVNALSANMGRELNEKIETLPYATETTKGMVKVWYTEEDGKNILNISTED